MIFQSFYIITSKMLSATYFQSFIILIIVLISSICCAPNPIAVEENLVVREDYNDTSKFLVIDDMIISKAASRAGLVNAAWPEGVVPFTFSFTMSPQQRMLVGQAMSEISSRTCIQFRPVRSDDQYSLLIQNDPLSNGCSSYVGWQNKKNQPVQLGNQCSRGNAIHELIHALGFFHEHTRNDRDEYVNVFYQNIKPGYESNFRREDEMDPPFETSYYDVPYNFESIMHYGKTYFTKNGKATIEPKSVTGALGHGDDIGQRDFISTGDVEMLNAKYNCGSVIQPDSPIDEVEEITEEPTDGSSSGNNNNNNNGNPVCQLSPTLPICFVNDEPNGQAK